MDHTTDFTLAVSVAASHAETVERVRALLADAGFGVLTEIDMQATLHAKLGVEIPAKLVLGACRPQLAHRALEIDDRIATLLPCNVVITARDDGMTDVEVFDPDLLRSFADAPELRDVTAEARERLEKMLAALGRTSEGIDHEVGA